MKFSPLMLNPDLPVCWEDEHTLRIGFDKAVVLLSDPSAGTQRLLSILRTGIGGLREKTLVRRTGLSPEQIRETLDLLEAALIDQGSRHQATPTESTIKVGVFGADPFATLLTEQLLGAGHRFATSSERAEFVVLVESFLGTSDLGHPLLVAGIPHLPIVLSDTTVAIGPLIPAAGALCLSCVELTRRDEEPLLPSLAAQVRRIKPASATPAVAQFMGNITSLVIHNFETRKQDFINTRLSFEVASGRPHPVAHQRSFSAHPECACSLL